MMEKYKELPALRGQLEETKQLLAQLEKSKDKISEQRYEQMSQRYREQIETLSEQVSSLEEQAKDQRVELQTRKELLEGQRKEAREEFEEHQLLHEQGAISDTQFKSQKAQWRSTQKKLNAKVAKIEADLEELQFYLTYTGEESYQKHRTMKQAGELKESALSGVNTIAEGAGKLLTPKRIIGAIVSLLVLAAIGVGVIYGVKGFESHKELRDARALMEQGNYQLATVKLQQELDANPGNTTAHFLMGQASLELDDLEQAKNAFDQVLLQNPDKNWEIAKSYLEKGKKIIRQDPADALHLMQLSSQADIMYKDEISSILLEHFDFILGLDNYELIGDWYNYSIKLNGEYEELFNNKIISSVFDGESVNLAHLDERDIQKVRLLKNNVESSVLSKELDDIIEDWQTNVVAYRNNIDAVRNDLATIAASSQGYYMKPKMLGGGGASFEDLSFNKISFNTSKISQDGMTALNENGVYILENIGREGQFRVKAHPKAKTNGNLTLASRASEVIIAIIHKDGIDIED